MPSYFAQQAYVRCTPTNTSTISVSNQWRQNVAFTVSEGRIESICPDAEFRDGMVRLAGPIVPTIANAHSHAFQRLMAGMAETASTTPDSFWGWREVMYRMLQQLSSEEVEIIASKLYIELLKGGYSQVGEFHYLHNQPDGKPYPVVTELGDALLRAGNRAGLGITLLPALYQYAGFGQQPASAAQARFVQSTEHYVEQYRQFQQRIAAQSHHHLGLCFHSLRATDIDNMQQVLATLDDDQPIHIHIAEQQKEVDDCLAYSGQRPVQWLLATLPIGPRWTLIHATHLSPEEVTALARSGATVGICTTTEANLGDGFFPARAYAAAGGLWCIGSDSHVSTSVQEELRWLEYGQRLQHQQRACLHTANQPAVADYLFNMAQHGGDRACGVKLGLATGARADFMMLRSELPFIAASQPQHWLSRWLFGLSDNAIQDVYVAGERVIYHGQHTLDNDVDKAFAEVIQRYF